MQAQIELVVESDLSIAAASDAARRALRFSPEGDYLGCGRSEPLIHPGDADRLASWCRTGFAPAGGPPQHLRLQHAEGGYRVFVVTFRAGGCAAGGGLRLGLHDVRALPTDLVGLDSPLISVLLETTNDFVFFKNIHHLFLAASRSMVDLCEPAGKPCDFVGKSDYEMFPAPMADCYYELEQKIYAGAEIAQQVQPFVRPDGSPGWVDNRKYPIRDPAGRLVGLYGIARDITERVSAVAAQAVAASVFETTDQGIVVLDEEGYILNANKAFVRAVGSDVESVIGRSIEAFRHASDGADSFRTRWRELVERKHWEGELVGKGPDGSWRVEYARFNAVEDAGGGASYYVGIYGDITALKRHEAELEQAANLDQLTGLPNRRLLFDRMRQALSLAERMKVQLAVCYLDLDGFKAVNDERGHAVGDELLIRYAERISSALRDGDTLARLGGDEFVVLLCGISDELDARITLQRLLQVGREAFRVAGEDVGLSVSIGVAFAPQDGADPDKLLRKADHAMYRAKGLGKDTFLFFDEVGAERGAAAHRMVSELSTAIAESQLTLHYQPRIHARTAMLAGVEALVRWEHPTLGLLQPGDFLPMISGWPLELALDEWVLRNAAAQYETWRSEGLEIPISVNLSPATLQSDTLAPLVHEVVRDTLGGARHVLELEVLETGAIEDMERVSAVMRDCLKFGVSFALDDFGTGYSSLTYFHRLPIATLKIDRLFVQNMLANSTDQAIVEGVIRLAQSLNRPVVAEGVEHLELGIMLLQLGCQYLQGFGIARPMAPDDLLSWLKVWPEEQAWHYVTRRHVGPTPLYELNVALISHSLWVQKARQLIEEGEVGSLRLEDLNDCGFARWVSGIGGIRYGSRAIFDQINDLHDAMHESLCRLVTDDKAKEPRTRRGWVAAFEGQCRSLSNLLRSLAQPEP